MAYSHPTLVSRRLHYCCQYQTTAAAAAAATAGAAQREQLIACNQVNFSHVGCDVTGFSGGGVTCHVGKQHALTSWEYICGKMGGGGGLFLTSVNDNVGAKTRMHTRWSVTLQWHLGGMTLSKGQATNHPSLTI